MQFHRLKQMLLIFLHYFIAHEREKLIIESIIFIEMRHSTEEGSPTLIGVQGEQSFHYRFMYTKFLLCYRG